MTAAQNMTYGSMLSPARQKQVQQAVAAHLEAVTCETDALYQLFQPWIARQTKTDLSADGAAERLWRSLKDSPLLKSKGEKINLGRYQAPVHVLNRTVDQYSTKAYLWNAAALSFGMKGFDRRTTPKVSTTEAPTGSTVVSATSLKASAHMPWSEQCANQLDRAAMLYGNLEGFFRQQVILRALGPTSEFHSRPWVWNTQQSTSS